MSLRDFKEVRFSPVIEKCEMESKDDDTILNSNALFHFASEAFPYSSSYTSKFADRTPARLTKSRDIPTSPGGASGFALCGPLHQASLPAVWASTFSTLSHH